MFLRSLLWLSIGLTLGAPLALRGQLVLSEFQASNLSTLRDDDGETEDWIEIANITKSPVDLAGWFLTDDPARLTKWEFPSTNLAAGQFLVIFASNKNRRVAGAPLHTNFKLDADGEYLALVKPDGVTIATAYSPAYPPQAENLTYGLPLSSRALTLLSAGAAGKFFVPSDGSLGTNWVAPGFDDTAWVGVNTGVGFDVNSSTVLVPVADSVADWNLDGVQGSRGWYYGYYNRSGDLAPGYQTNDFSAFPRKNEPYGTNNFWTGTQYWWPSGLGYWDLVGQTDVHPNGINNGAEHWVIRRWISHTNGIIQARWRLYKTNPSGSGVTGQLYHNGVLVDSAAIAGTDNAGVDRTAMLGQVRTGDVIDLAVTPIGPDGSTDDGSDGSATVLSLSSLQSMTNLIASQVASLMRSSNASGYLRLPIVVDSTEDLTQLALRLRYNDGVVGYLNGVLVLTRNAPNSASEGTQADSAADWSYAGQQGVNNWYYGFYNKGADADGVYDPSTDFNNTDAQWTWNGGAWVLGPGNPPWDMISAGGWNPNGSNSGGVHWPIRRWISRTSGLVTCRIAFAKEDVACGSGTTLRVLHNGAERFSWTVAYNDASGLQTNLVLSNLQEGDYLDFALDPRGTDGSETDGCDGSTFSAIITQDASEGAIWNSTATIARSPQDSATQEEISLSRYRDLVVAGTNILALHGLNCNAADGDFLILPELSATYEGMSSGGQRGYFTAPTPGAINGVGSLTIGPIISEVQHWPAYPVDGDDLSVRALITPTLRPVKEVSLVYRVMYAGEVTLPMFDDGNHGDGLAGDSVYGGRIPASASAKGQMVRYCILAKDTNSQQMRVPSYMSATRSPQYFGAVVYDPALTNSRLPILHWFIQSPGSADSDYTARSSVYYRGVFYDNVGVNIHGQSTRGFPKKSYDFDFNPGHKLRWSDDDPLVGDLNLLTTWADKTHMRHILAHETYRDSGSPAHFAFPVRVQQNGAFFSVANVVESGDDDFLERLGLDPQGALYKMYNAAESVSTNEKKTRKWEGTSDLQALINGMGLSGTAGQAFMFDNLDVPEVVNFLAAKIITADTDCCHKNYYLYRDSDDTGEWQAMPWDVDLSFGRVWTCQTPCYAYYDETIYTNQSIFVGSGNRVFNPIYATPFTRQMFLRRLRTLMDELFQPPSTPATNDFYRLKTEALRDQIAPDAALDLAKWGTWSTRETITQAVNRIWNEFLPGRRGFLFNKMVVGGGGEIPLSQPTNPVVLIDGLEYRPASGNPLQEWLSLTNANTYAVDISNWRLDGGARFKFKPGTVIPARSTIFVSPNTKAFRSRSTSPKGGERRLVVGPYDGNLSAWGENIVLLDTAGRLVNSNYYAGNPSPAQRYLRVTEISYNPGLFAANTNIDPQLFEFLELRNIGPTALDLRGVRLTEGVQFDFGSGAITNLQAGARVLVVRDPAAFTLRYGSGRPVAGQFLGRLDNGGERLRLEDAYGEKILDFSYNDTWYPITDGHGYSLAIVDDTILWSLWGEKASWRPNGTLGGTPGQSDTVLPPIAPVVINEILAHTDPPLADAIELYNPTATNVNVGNWYLTDNFDAPLKFRIPNPTWIEPRSFVHFTEAHFNNTPGTPPSFVLNSEGDDVWLFSADAQSTLTGHAQGFDFGATANAVSLGRHVNSIGEVDYVAQLHRTLGQSNSAPLVGPVVLSEIMYHPAPAPGPLLSQAAQPHSYIELANLALTNVPLFNPSEITNTWRLRNGVDFDFPTNIIMPPRSRLLIVGFNPANDPATLTSFRTMYEVPAGVPILGPWEGGLANDNDTIELKKPDPAGISGVPYVMVEKVHYRDGAPWPEGADGTGLSLQRRGSSAYGNEPTNWFVSAPTTGSPNTANTAPAVQLLAPAAGTVYRRPANIFMSASAVDSDGTIQRVKFLKDAQVLAEVTAEPYSYVWTNPPPGICALSAIAVDDQSASTASTPVHVTVIPPPPVVSMNQPADGLVALAGSALELSANATSSESSIDRVDFYANGVLIRQLLAAPFVTTWSPGTTGSFALAAVAVDSWGSAATSAVVQVAFSPGTNFAVTLVAKGSTWKYLDNGSNQGTNWVGLNFPDATWKSGAGELGYGDETEGRPEATEISYGTNSSAKHITYYFRHAFSVSQADSIRDLTVNVLRDDGAVAYLNGRDVYRNLLPSTPGYLTLASNAVAGTEETIYFQQAVPSSWLREGTNILAVEVHQSSTGSSDLSFDLSLTANRVLTAPAIFAQPASLAVPWGGDGALSVIAGGTAPLGYQWTLEGGAVPGATAPTINVLDAQLSDLGSYRVLISNSVGSALSAPAVLTFLDGPAANQIIISPSGSGYRLLYRGTPGNSISLERSGDLLDWTAVLETVVPSHGIIEYLESSPRPEGAYYRAHRK